MPPPAGTDPLELVALAQRLGIPADDAIQLVVRHLDQVAVEHSAAPLAGAAGKAKHQWRRGARPRRRRRADALHPGAEAAAEREQRSEV